LCCGKLAKVEGEWKNNGKIENLSSPYFAGRNPLSATLCHRDLPPFLCLLHQSRMCHLIGRIAAVLERDRPLVREDRTPNAVDALLLVEHLRGAREVLDGRQNFGPWHRVLLGRAPPGLAAVSNGLCYTTRLFVRSRDTRATRTPFPPPLPTQLRGKGGQHVAKLCSNRYHTCHFQN